MQDDDDSYTVALHAAKARNLGHLLMRAARLLNEHGIARMQARSAHTNFRLAHTRLIPHIDLEGTRQTVIAERVNISKQAVGQLVAELEEAGMVKRTVDPSDRRARLVRFTDAGRQEILSGLALLARLEADLAAAISPSRVERLKDDLTTLLAALEDEDALPSP